MAKYVFQRTEKKYLVTADSYNAIVQELFQYMQPDRHNKDGAYTISNLYLDTADHYYIRRSLEKPQYKEKLRLRGYGVPGLEDTVYLEIKKKLNGVVSKRRCPLSLCDAYELLQDGTLPAAKTDRAAQVLRELCYTLDQRPVAAALYLAYDRIAFADPHTGLRVTFDENIRTRRADVRLESGDFGQPLLREGVRIMEVKAEGAIPVWLTRLLAHYGLRPGGFSKYGAEYSRGHAEFLRERGREVCLRPSWEAVLTQPSLIPVQFLAS